ncbi:MAG: hypothetical protein GKR94_30140 [Gammaproteobacteria bacterium]|nr:hypothetical protein [Gammaproteobacteria bacterium]
MRICHDTGEFVQTEMVTGEDPVARRLGFASGLERLKVAPLADSYTGHAIEWRIYAENRTKKFLPSPVLLTRFPLPPASATVRVDTGFTEGGTITAFYGPMIAKVITCAGYWINRSSSRVIPIPASSSTFTAV